MNIKNILRKARKNLRLTLFRLKHIGQESFLCPVCGYCGPFSTFNVPTGNRKHAQCPSCGALERGRIQYVVMKDLLDKVDASKLKILHFSPEEIFQKLFREKFREYESADYDLDTADHKADIQNMQFADNSYDFVYASHVLEHVQDDLKALSEIKRILKPGGIAVLPVPIVAGKTIEYPEPIPTETYHVRAPGYDYFNRYEQIFSKVEKFSSDTLPAKYQLYIYEDRSHWPTAECPLRLPMAGEKHIDIVPICYV